MKSLRVVVYISFLFCYLLVNIIPDLYAYEDNNISVVVNGEKLRFKREIQNIKGTVLVPAQALIWSLDGEIEWNETRQEITIFKDDTRIKMKINRDYAIVDRIVNYIDVGARVDNGMIMIPLRYICEQLNEHVEWHEYTQSILVGDNRIYKRQNKDYQIYEKTVVIDPGHGGSDPGAVYFGVRESHINLQISEKVNKLLKQKGIKTYMTRIEDKDVSLYDRSGLVDIVNADLLVSIHNNAGSNSTTGTMTLYHPQISNMKDGVSSYIFANDIQNQLVKDLGTKNLGLYERPNLAVLRTSNVPAVLIEVGYMSNYSEFIKLTSDNYQDKVAISIVDGILKVLFKMK